MPASTVCLAGTTAVRYADVRDASNARGLQQPLHEVDEATSPFVARSLLEQELSCPSGSYITGVYGAADTNLSMLYASFQATLPHSLRAR
jgi:hypothetical protein